MDSRLYVSTNEASYFVNNSLSCAPNPPTEGNYIVGDVVISSSQKHGIFGWVCVKSGEPGTWEVICDIVDVRNDVESNRLDIDELIRRVSKNELDIDNTENAIKLLDNRVGNNENEIKQINTQINIAKNTLVSLDNRISENTKHINDVEGDVDSLSQTVRINANTCASGVNNLQNELNTLKTVVGANADSAGEATSGLMKEINDLKEIVGANADSAGEATSGLMKEINDLKEIVGANADSAGEAATGLQKEINDLKEIVGANADSAGETASGIMKEINDLKEIVGANADSAGEATTGLQKEINDLKDFVGIGKDNTEGGNLLDQVEQLNNKTSTIGTVDIFSKNIVSDGALIDDSAASHGKCYKVSSSNVNRVVYRATLDDIKFGQYGICLRMKCSVSKNSIVARVRIFNGETYILDKQLNANEFAVNYTLIYGAFTYDVIGNSKNNLVIQVETIANAGVDVSFDYAYVNMIIPSVFL